MLIDFGGWTLTELIVGGGVHLVIEHEASSG